ncbi:MAG TPA: class I SAM-dependent methyltransferase [Pirellulales bacterium]|jgi:trans-aconitate methyltransferase|nr:class I SAM-dependent methyltransferase [Pirellulales bacterium]
MTEWLADDYHQQSSLQTAMAEEQLAKLTLQGAERILDVGCGDGKISAAIAARVRSGSVLGVDPSRDMIAFAASHFGPSAHENLRFDVADVRQLPYRHEFDLVVSFNALHWVPEQVAALGSIHAALKPGGQALLRFVPEGQRKCLEDVIEEVRSQDRWAGYFRNFQRPYAHFTAQDYRALAEQCGFSVVRLDVEDKAWDFKTRPAFEAFARATFAEWTQHLPASEWPAFISEVLDRYQSVAANQPSELNTFKFYQLEIVLAPLADPSER